MTSKEITREELQRIKAVVDYVPTVTTDVVQIDRSRLKRLLDALDAAEERDTFFSAVLSAIKQTVAEGANPGSFGGLSELRCKQALVLIEQLEQRRNAVTGGDDA